MVEGVESSRMYKNNLKIRKNSENRRRRIGNSPNKARRTMIIVGVVCLLASFITGIVIFSSNGQLNRTFNLGGRGLKSITELVAWDISASSALYSEKNFTTGSISPHGLFFKIDGTQAYVVDSNDHTIRIFNLSTAWELGVSASFSHAWDYTARALTSTGMSISRDGTKMYLISDQAVSNVIEYDLTIPWEITSASYVANFSIQSEEITPRGFSLSPDGTKYYVVGAAGTDINEYNMTVAYDITSSVYSTTYDLDSKSASPEGIMFSEDGTKMIICGAIRNLFEYNLSKPWLVGTGVWSQTRSVVAEVGGVGDCYFKPDSTRFYVTDVSAPDAVFQYNISDVLITTLNSPENNAGFPVPIVDLNCSATDSVQINNLTLYLDGVKNKTIIGTGAYEELNITVTVSGGSHDWTCLATNTNDEIAWVANRTFIIDSVNPDINITYPINNTNWTNVNLDVNFTRSDDITLRNCWYSNDTYLVNSTPDVNCGNVTSVVWSEGNHNVTVWANDSAGNINSSRISFMIDSVNPDINITFPINNTQYISTRIDINYTVSDANLESCWYSNDTYLVNITLPSCGNLTDIVWSEGQHNVTVWANDSFGHINRTSINFSTQNFLEHSQTFNTNVDERSSQTFSINVTYDSATYTNIQALLYYNGSTYAGTKIGSGNNVVFSRIITVPEVSTKTNFTFYWGIDLITTPIFKVNSTFSNQTVNHFTVDDCSSDSIGLYNFTIVDERTQKKLVGGTANTSAVANIQIYSSDRSILVTNYSQNFTKTNPFRVCLNSSLGSGEEYSADLQIRYTATGYVEEYYHIQASSITSSSLAQNITLFNLDNVTSTTFVITYKDSSFLPLSNAIIQVQRKYVGEGLFKTVEIPKTDSNGKTIAHLEEEDVIYTFIVVKNGIIQATFTDFLVKCSDPILGKCEININDFKSSIETETFINKDDFAFTLTFNKTTRTVKSVYSVPSGTSAVVTLNTTLADGLGTTVVCSDRLVSASGTLSCVVPTSFGNTTVITSMVKDGKLVGYGMLTIQESPASLYGNNLMFLGLFLMVMMIGVGLGSSPMISGIFLIVGAVVAIPLNLVTNTGFVGAGATILWLIIAVVVILMKGARRE